MPVLFHAEATTFSYSNPVTARWVESVIQDYEYIPGQLNFIFCSDDFLLDINQRFLDHDFYTDIITFPTSDEKNVAGADLYISVDRVKENASTLKVVFEEELHRVMIHGILHLLGFDDKSESEKRKIREEENRALEQLKSMHQE